MAILRPAGRGPCTQTAHGAPPLHLTLRCLQLAGAPAGRCRGLRAPGCALLWSGCLPRSTPMRHPPQLTAWACPAPAAAPQPDRCTRRSRTWPTRSCGAGPAVGNRQQSTASSAGGWVRSPLHQAHAAPSSDKVVGPGRPGGPVHGCPILELVGPLAGHGDGRQKQSARRWALPWRGVAASAAAPGGRCGSARPQAPGATLLQVQADACYPCLLSASRVPPCCIPCPRSR